MTIAQFLEVNPSLDELRRQRLIRIESEYASSSVIGVEEDGHVVVEFGPGIADERPVWTIPDSGAVLVMMNLITHGTAWV